MLGLTSFPRLTHRERTIILALAAVTALVGLSALAPSPARASGCTDSWTNTAGGSWFTESNWSTGKVPGPEDEACITAAGTYTVTMYQNSSTVSVRSLTIGAASGAQTLTVGSTCSLNAILATTAGVSNGARGEIALTNGDGCGDNVTVTGPVTNAGVVVSEQANGGSRTLQGNLTNTGTLTIGASTAYNSAGTLLTNHGKIAVAEGKTLTASSGAAITNGTGAKINATGSGDVLVTGGTFTEGAGTTSGSKPVIVDDGTLTYAGGGGASLIALRGTSSLTGASSTGQSLSLESTCSENASITAAAGFTNGGAITLTNGDTCGDSVTLAISAGTLTNSGTITSENDHGGGRSIQGSLANTGTLAINANTAYNGTSAPLTNEGTIDLAEGKQLAVAAKDSLANDAGGSIAAVGSGNVLVSGGTFSQGAGTTSGSEPVLVDDGTLEYTGAGASQIALRGSTALSGNLSAGQSLSIQSTCNENATATAAASFTNAGAIALTNGDACGDSATLAISAGTLTNSGKLSSEAGHGGARSIEGNLTNTGTLAINLNTAYNGTGAALVNEGAIEVAESRQFTVSGGGTLVNGSGGAISAGAAADVLMSATTFTEGAGTTAGTKPVIVDDGTLNYTGAGASQIALRGSTALSGNLSAGQSLSVQSTCNENATATAAASYTNGGTITLTNGDSCGNSATLATSAGTLTNSGEIASELLHGGTRQIDGNLTNTGTLVINANTGFPSSGASLLNDGVLEISGGVALSATGDGTVTNGPGGAIDAAGDGSLSETGGTFDQGLGGATGSLPIVLDDSVLNYTEHGSGKIGLRGSSTVSGAIKNNETLLIESTCNENATATAAGSFVSNGIIELTNGDGCGNSATLNLSGGTLTNDNTINVDDPSGGGRTIEGNVTNNQMVSIAAGETLSVTGSYTQTAAAKLRTYITGSSTYGALSVAGAAAIAGTLITHATSFKGALGQKYAILGAGSLTGTFATETEDQINYTGLYYKPTYSATGVALLVSQATQARAPKSGLPGSVLTVTGSGYLPGDTITPTFTDHAGEKTVYPTVTTNGSGEFTLEMTIPAAAAAGAGTIVTTSSLTGVHISETFTVS